MTARDLAIRDFKRNADLKCVHVVLSNTFSSLSRATDYAKSINGKVTSIFRTECAEELGGHADKIKTTRKHQDDKK